MFFLFLKWRYFSGIITKYNPFVWESALYHLIYLCVFLLYYNLYVTVFSALMYRYCVSIILQRINTVNKIWWYKQIFLKLCFWAKRNLKPNMHIVVIWLSLNSSLFSLFTFQCFSSVCFPLFFNVFCSPLHDQEDHDSKQKLLKNDVNARL